MDGSTLQPCAPDASLSGWQRACPLCGSWSDASTCEVDGTPTVLVATGVAVTAWRPGDRIGSHYRLERFLAKGGWATVFAAIHEHTGERSAIKLMHRPHDLAHVRRFYREAGILALLRDAHTVRVKEAGQAPDGSLFLAMELVEGETLDARLLSLAQRGLVLTQEEAVTLAIQTLGSLGEAHAAGLVHRDIKPSNLMLASGASGIDVKLLDFGIAVTADGSLTTTGKVVGTPAYMSPEQCEAGTVDGRSDLYALGIVLYRCVCGRTPFEESANIATMYAHVHSPVPDLQRAARTPVTPAFADIVHRALAKAPDDRFADAHAMRWALENLGVAPAWAGQRDVETLESAPGVAASQPSTRSPLRWPHIAAGLALAAFAATLALPSRDAPALEEETASASPLPQPHHVPAPVAPAPDAAPALTPSAPASQVADAARVSTIVTAAVTGEPRTLQTPAAAPSTAAANKRARPRNKARTRSTLDPNAILPPD